MSEDDAFDAAVAVVLRHEGGYQCDREDPGNWTSGRVGAGELKGTKYGISAMSYPTLDIAGLGEAEARAIYHRDWWVRYGLARLPAAVGAKVLDAAVDIGPTPAMRCLQRALRASGRRVTEDGVLGPETLQAVIATPADILLPALREAVAGHYRAVAQGRPQQARYLAGWLARAYS